MLVLFLQMRAAHMDVASAELNERHLRAESDAATRIKTVSLATKVLSATQQASAAAAAAAAANAAAAAGFPDFKLQPSEVSGSGVSGYDV
jgi:hypothetical protein